MQYPGLPNNRLIVNGVDLSTEYGMILLDGYTLSPPEPKTYTVDIPGGDGVIDLTEGLTGDVAYNNREQEFTFAIIDVDDWERSKTMISNFLHGRLYDYKITMDPEYTYHGRFTVEEYGHAVYVEGGTVGSLKVKVSADPYKLKEHRVIETEAIGGKVIECTSGRKKVRPIITTNYEVLCNFNGDSFYVPKGSHRLSNVLFVEGINRIYFNTYRITSTTWHDARQLPISSEVVGLTYAEAKRRNYRWSDVQRWVKDNYTNVTRWDDISDETWDDADISSKSWNDLNYQYQNNVPSDATIRIEYDVKDL